MQSVFELKYIKLIFLIFYINISKGINLMFFEIKQFEKHFKK
jgi:hypothetical protein